MASPFYKERHVKYFQKSSILLPHHYTQLDSSRLTALYFIVVGLDMLGAVEQVNREQVIDYVYRHQLSPSSEDDFLNGYFGFIGGSFVGTESASATLALKSYQLGHLAMIYTALMILLTLDDDLSRIDRLNIGRGNNVYD